MDDCGEQAGLRCTPLASLYPADGRLYLVIVGACFIFQHGGEVDFARTDPSLLFILVRSSWGMVKKRGWKYFLPCMLSFFLLHFSRGFGSAASYLSKHYWRGDRVHEEQRYDKNATNIAR